MLSKHVGSHGLVIRYTAFFGMVSSTANVVGKRERSQSFSPHDRCPKDMCGTPQFSFFGHPSFYNKRHTSINFHFVASKTFVTVTPFSFHFVWATRSTQYVWTKALSAACTPTSSELSSFNPGDGRQTPEPALEPQEPPESKLKPKAQAGKHCMIRILIMRTFHNLRTSPEPAPKAALKRTGLRPRTQRCWKKNCICRWTKSAQRHDTVQCAAVPSSLAFVMLCRSSGVFSHVSAFLEICHRSPCTKGVKRLVTYILHILSELDRVPWPGQLTLIY